MFETVFKWGALRSFPLRKKYVAYGVGVLIGLSFLAVTDATSNTDGFTVGQPAKDYEVIHEDVFCEKLQDKGTEMTIFIFSWQQDSLLIAQIGKIVGVK